MNTNAEITSFGWDPSILHVIELCIAVGIIAGIIYVLFRICRRLFRGNQVKLGPAGKSPKKARFHPLVIGKSATLWVCEVSSPGPLCHHNW